ncbi:hypothetical protein [Thermobispora bispora]|uniref:Uncharacterized protein n=1 Tax=Thermobispora bispora (strain ATCC 19993 / DSM 43833 / CBS 139.67 / JCM 10125 / KCTC 9307 / NBRC 14880 / R51) TaxID=469371 RepID=D6Y8H8_THEBD|nr:hypothetical protein [Thermobispora bispora]ADG87875.1 hypothetical protein Tbis_1153 [Thermobispora bispora DSM 43833]
MTLPPDDELGELLRRALHAEADSVEPSPDGLEIIRTRIERRRLRNLWWWRAGASVVGVVLAAAAVVTIFPGLRTQVVERTIMHSSDDREVVDTSSIRRPPASPSAPAVAPTADPEPSGYAQTPIAPQPPQPSDPPSPSPSPSPCASDDGGPAEQATTAPADEPAQVCPTVVPADGRITPTAVPGTRRPDVPSRPSDQPTPAPTPTQAVPPSEQPEPLITTSSPVTSESAE